MLEHEKNVVYHADVAESKLDRVAGDTRPVALEVRVYQKLGNAKHAADEVEQNASDGPTLGAPVAEVGEELGEVLDDGDEQFDVGDGVHHIEPGPIGGGVGIGGDGGDDEDHDADGDEGAKEEAEDGTRGPSARGRLETP